jgi:hypothetical protein
LLVPFTDNVITLQPELLLPFIEAANKTWNTRSQQHKEHYRALVIEKYSRNMAFLNLRIFTAIVNIHFRVIRV